jgi:hypothetical protein
VSLRDAGTEVDALIPLSLVGCLFWTLAEKRDAELDVEDSAMLNFGEMMLENGCWMWDGESVLHAYIHKGWFQRASAIVHVLWQLP